MKINIKYFVYFVVNKLIPSLSEQLLYPLSLFILTPLIINILGELELSKWIILVTILNLSPLVCLGCTSWLPKKISEANALGDQKGIEEVLGCNLAVIILCVGLLCVILVFANVIFLYDDITVYFLKLACVCIFFQELDNLYSNATKGLELFLFSFFLEITGRLIWFLLIIAGVLSDNLLIFTCIAVMFKSIFKIITFQCIIFKHKLIIPFFDFKKNKKLICESFWMLIQLVGGLSTNSVDKFLIPILLGMNQLAAYNPCLQLSQFAFTLPSAANQILIPIVSKYHILKRFPSLFILKLLMAVFFSSLPGVFLFIFSFEILEIWINKQFAFNNYKILNILSAAYTLLGAMSVLHFTLIGMSKHKLVAKINLLSGVVTFFFVVTIAPLGLIYLSMTKYITPLFQLSYIFIIIRKGSK